MPTKDVQFNVYKLEKISVYALNCNIPRDTTIRRLQGKTTEDLVMLFSADNKPKEKKTVGLFIGLSCQNSLPSYNDRGFN